MWPMDPQASTSTMLNPTGSLDLSSAENSFARLSPASKCVTPFCSGRPCFATFSRWKLKKTNLPRKRERPVLRLMTSDGFSSDRIEPGLRAQREGLTATARVWGSLQESVGLRGRRPWKEGVKTVEAMGEFGREYCLFSLLSLSLFSLDRKRKSED
ncbi:unnamed protein product, partial [Musa acuminata subsp. malaccensis]